MSKFEIWGWNGSKQEFANIYKEKTNVDLNNGYCCVAELRKMGYEHAFSLIFFKDINDYYLSGKLNWDLIERVTIIRQVSKNKYTKIAADTLCQDFIAKLVLDIQKKDSLSLNQFFIENPSLFDEILIGTLAVNKEKLRDNCYNLINKRLENSTFVVSNTELEILSSMLSFPYPRTCYCAIKTISRTTIKNKKILFNDGAETIKDFLNSNLQSFKADAMSFLKVLEPNGKNYSCEEWIKWIKNNGC